jgi:hypothetical protein
MILLGTGAAAFVALAFLGCWLIARSDPEVVGLARLKLRSSSLDQRIELFAAAVVAGDYVMADRAVRKALDISVPPEGAGSAEQPV